jgi:hypothetical protein
MACSGDGESATDQHGEVRECPCDHLAKRRCKPSGTLYCSIALPGHAVAGSVHKLRTTSIITIQQMVGSLQHIQATVGVLQGVPLTLRMGPMSVSPDGKATTVYVCWLELRASDINAVQQQALAAAQTRRALQVAIGVEPTEPTYRELVAASETATVDEDAPEHYTPEPEPIEIPAEIPQPTEHPRDAVLREGKALGLTKTEIGDIVTGLIEQGTVRKNADDWTEEYIAIIRDKMEAYKEIKQ